MESNRQSTASSFIDVANGLTEQSQAVFGASVSNPSQLPAPALYNMH